MKPSDLGPGQTLKSRRQLKQYVCSFDEYGKLHFITRVIPKSSKVSPSFRSKAGGFSFVPTRTSKMKTQRPLEARNGQMLKPKWRSWYSTQQRILLVGEGDFSFSSSLATELGVATNMVSTSLDSKGELLKKYGMEAELNTLNLSQHGALVFHGFDACKMATKQKNLLCGLRMSNFHRIIFNFPRVGNLRREDLNAHGVKKNKELVRLFFENARDMLLPRGQVHVSLKLGSPYDSWNLEEQAQVSGLRLVKRVPFHREHFPGYQIRRVDGPKKFKLGPADTFIFAARTEEPRASTLNSEPIRMNSDMLYHLKSLKEKAIRKARATQVTPLQQVVADEVARLEELKEEKKLGKKKMKTLKTLKSALEEMHSPTSVPGGELELQERTLSAIRAIFVVLCR